MAEQPAHPVSLSLFELITEKAAEIRANPKVIDAEVSNSDKAMEFCEDFFQQFLKAAAGISINGFDINDKEEVARARMQSKAAPARAVMAQYEKLCDFYFELQGSVFVRGAGKRFRVTYVTRLLTRIQAWTKSIDDPELTAKVKAVAADYKGAVGLE